MSQKTGRPIPVPTQLTALGNNTDTIVVLVTGGKLVLSRPLIRD
jgi:hypothetical protein